MTLKRPIQMCVFAFLQIILPIYLIYNSIANSYDTIFIFIVNNSLHILSMYFIFLSVYWENFNYYLRYIFFISVIICTGISLFRFEAKAVFSYKDVIEDIDAIILLPVFIVLVINIILSKHQKHKKIDIDLSFPFKEGKYLIAEGGDGKKSFFTNYHYKFKDHAKWKESMRYAVDIVKINSIGFTMDGIIPLNNEKYYIFKQEVYCPIDGIVYEVINNVENNIPYSGNYLRGIGNHVIIKKDNYFIILAHLEKNTVNLIKGQYINKGEYIGEIGNSGYSNRPHLHMQVIYNDGSNIWKGTGVQFTLNGKMPVKNMRICID